MTGSTTTPTGPRLLVANVLSFLSGPLLLYGGIQGARRVGSESTNGSVILLGVACLFVGQLLAGRLRWKR